MVKRRSYSTVIIVSIFVVLLVLTAGIILYYQTNSNPPIEDQHQCTPDMRNVACTAQYDPVCGWFDPSIIQCIRYPCAQTYSNDCVACADNNVAYWTSGQCPN